MPQNSSEIRKEPFNNMKIASGIIVDSNISYVILASKSNGMKISMTTIQWWKLSIEFNVKQTNYANIVSIV